MSVHYVGVAWSTGQQFDASWDRGETFTFRVDDTKRENDFTLHIGRVVEGMDTVRRIHSAPTSPTEGEGSMRGQMLFRVNSLLGQPLVGSIEFIIDTTLCR